MSCRCRKIDCASVRGLTAHGYSLIARKPAVGVGATWRFAGTPPSLGASTHARVSGARVDVMSEGNNQLMVVPDVFQAIFVGLTNPPRDWSATAFFRGKIAKLQR